LTFVAQPEAASILCLSASTAGIISPKPVSTSIEVAAEASVTLSLGRVASGNYCIVVQAHGWPCPGEISCDPGGSEAVLRISGAHADFPGQGDTPVGN